MSDSHRWFHEVREATDARLVSFFVAERARATELAPEAVLLCDAIESLTTRGGKRLRAAVLVASFRSVAPARDFRDAIDACAALELLQSYLLIHDDLMDGDEERRGGPSGHVALAAACGDRVLGGHLAILAGDLGSAWAQQLIASSLCRAALPEAVLAAFVRMQVEVTLGQALDLRASHDVERMQRLKTGSYTVDGPLALGAAFGGATSEQLAALTVFGRPLGEAFQLRDDLLGTFGDRAVTGKPTGNDLRAGKRTALVRECERTVPADARMPLDRVLGRSDASDVEIAAAMELLVASGTRRRVEERLAALVDDARAVLASAPLEQPGVQMLGEVASLLAVRDR